MLGNRRRGDREHTRYGIDNSSGLFSSLRNRGFEFGTLLPLDSPARSLQLENKTSIESLDDLEIA